jgi:hypothetical protein
MPKNSLRLQPGNILAGLSKLQIYNYTPANCPFLPEGNNRSDFQIPGCRNEKMEVGL